MAEDKLNFGDLISAVRGVGQSARFPGALDGELKRWLFVAYQDVWDAADWTFKKVRHAAWNTSLGGGTAGVAGANPHMPSDFAEAIQLIDDQGNEPLFLQFEQFDRAYSAVTSTGRPEAWTIVDRQIWLAPAPDATYQMKLSYRRRLSHKDALGDVMGGWFTTSTDLPLWDDHHGILVPRAQVIALKSIRSPEWPPLQEEYEALLVNMLSDYIDRASRPRQYGRVDWS